MSHVNIGNDLIELDFTGSTNDYCRKLLKEGILAEGTVILADFQSEGKGQSGSFWESEKGKNLTFSIILYPEFLNVRKQFLIAMSISMALIDFLSHISINSEIKWPNDIYVNNRKIAGILIENSVIKDRIINSVIGIGININQKVFSRNIPNPTSFILESDKSADLKITYKSLLLYLNKWINLLYDLKYARIKESYLKHLLLLNKKASYTDITGKFEGAVVGIEEDGMLLIKTDSGNIRKYYFREVSFPV